MLTKDEILAQIPGLLRFIAMADKTTYEHHEPRKMDGKQPEEGEGGGTIWMTPREVAIHALRAMGEETESVYWPFKKPAPASPSSPPTGKEG